MKSILQMFRILKNNYCRIGNRLPAMLVMTAVAMVSIVLAVYVTGMQQVKGRVVFVSQSGSAPVNTKYLSIVTKTEEPPFSALVKQQYDAYVVDRGDGNYEIKTLKNEEFRNTLLRLLQNPAAAVGEQRAERGVGVNIIGFLLLFLLMGTSMNLFTFADDKEKGQLVRIASSPVSFPAYLSAHCISCLTMYLPPYLMLAVMKALGYAIGFSLLQYALLFFLIGFMGISVSILLNTLIDKPDNATMLGNSLLVLTSILAGSFYSFSKNNAILDWIIRFLPQKQLLDAAQAIQNGGVFAHPVHLLYTFVFCASLFTVSCILLTRRYSKKIR